MAKTKQDKSVQNKHHYSRASYLYQAAAYLSAHTASRQDPLAAAVASPREPDSSTQPDTTVSNEAPESHDAELAADEAKQAKTTTAAAAAATTARPLPRGSERYLITHLRGVGLKTHTRLSRDIKRSLCKRCDTLLVPARTSTAGIENASKGGRKPWADVYVVTCLVCGTEKRFPAGMEQQKRKGMRGEQRKKGGAGSGGASKGDESAATEPDAANKGEAAAAAESSSLK